MDYGLASNNAIIPANTVTQTARAFTGHEQIAEISGLIHMNARLYDSDIGRFLSADTYIQAPHDSQSYNRYSYVRNNPLVYTDPTGHSWFSKLWKKVKKYIRTIASIVVAAVVAIAAPYLIPALAGGGFWATVGIGALAGAAAGAVATGTLKGALKGALFGAIGAGLATGIGHGIGLEGAGNLFAKGVNAGKLFIKSALHGLSRGIISMAQGGTFKSGFASGFASSFFSPGTSLGGTGGGGFTLRTSIAAIVGGTASKLGGGKFSNGAVSGAFVHMFNAEGVKLMRSNPYSNNPKSMEERAKYYTQEARMARGEALANELRAYSEPLMVAAGTGVIVLVGGEVVVIGRQWVVTHPNEATSFVQGYNATTNYNPVTTNWYYHAGRATREFTDWLVR